MKEKERKPIDWLKAIVFAALLVNIPRFIVYSLKADGISTPSELEAVLISVSSVGMGIVFSGGQLGIAHLLPSLEEGIAKNIIVSIWVLMLVFAVIIISPFMVAGIIAQPDLKTVLAEWWQVWLWAITSIAAAEIVAAGVMLAQSLPKKRGHKTGVSTRGQGGKRERSVPRVRVMRPYAGQLSAQSTAQLGMDKVDRQRTILKFYMSNPTAGQRTAQAELGIPKSTVAKDLSELEAGGAVNRSEAGVVKVMVSPDQWS